MRIPADVAEWVVEAGVLTRQHMQIDGPEAVLTEQAGRALTSGHLVLYLLHNEAHRAGQPPPQCQLLGLPGEAVSRAQLSENWRALAKELAGLGVEIDAADTARADFAATLLQDLHRFFTGAGDSISMLSSSPRNATTVSADASIAGARERYLRRLAQEQEQELAAERKRRNAAQLKEFMLLSLNVERRRLDLDAVGPAPLPVYTEYRNRAAVALCHSVVEEIVADVVSGDAMRRLDAEWQRKQAAREVLLERRAAGRRLMDVSSVHVGRDVDRRVVVLAKELVDDMVERSMDPGIVAALAERDAARARERELARNAIARVKAEAPTRRRTPPDVRAQRAKAEAEAAERDERERKEEWLRAARVANREYAEEQLLRRRRRQEAEWEAAAAEREKERRKREAVEEHRQRGKLATLHAKMRRLLLELEGDERRSLAATEQDTWKRLAGVATRERRLIREQEAADAEPVVPLSSVSPGTGLAAAYIGSSYGSQFLTAVEASFLDATLAPRADPAAAAARMDTLRGRFSGFKVLLDAGDRPQPLTLVEGSAVAAEAADWFRKARPARPLRPEPSIGLTLAARDHACDLARRGIANTFEHIGGDGSSVSQRVGRYGWGAGLKAASPTELVVGLVRPSEAPIAPSTFADLLSLSDGDERRTARKALMGSGQNFASVGVGHAMATLETHTVEVFCLIFAAEFADKGVSQMASAHTASVERVAPGFLAGRRRVDPDKVLRDLFAVTNLVVGRTAKLPDTNGLVKPLRTGGPRPHRVRSPSAPRAREQPKRAAGGASQRQQQHAPIHSATPEPVVAETFLEGDHTPSRLSPIRRRAEPQQDLRVAKPRRDPPPKPAFVNTRPLPPVQSPAPGAAGVTATTLRAVAVFHLLLSRRRRRADLETLAIAARQQELEHASVAMQSAWRGHQGRERAARARSDAAAEAAEDMMAQSAAEQRAALIGHRVLLAESLTVVHEMVDAAATTAETRATRDRRRQRALRLLMDNGAEDSAALAQLSRYDGRERELLVTLLRKYGPEAELVAAATELHSALSLDSVAPRDALEQHAADEDEYLAALDELRVRCKRIAGKWRGLVLRRTGPEATAARMIQRAYRSAFCAERRAYVRDEQPRIRLQLRLERFYRRYNEEKLADCPSLARKYVGNEDRLFNALVAKYGPEPEDDPPPAARQPSEEPDAEEADEAGRD